MGFHSAETSIDSSTSATSQPRRKGHLLVSPRLREEFANGHTYYALEGQQLQQPNQTDATPDTSLLAWHSETIFQAS